MLYHTTKETRGQFLLELIKHAIKNTKTAHIAILEETLKEVIPDEPQKIKQERFSKNEILERIKKQKLEQLKQPKKELKEEIKKPLPVIQTNLKNQNTLRTIKNQPRFLSIPEPKLPKNLSYLKPSIKTNENLDLQEINPLIKDPNVFEIESQGHNTQIIVNGTMGRKNTNIVLKQDQIDNILEIFSKKAKIPISVGVTRIVVGNLMLTAILTKNGQTQFKIKKMKITPPRPNLRY